IVRFIWDCRHLAGEVWPATMPARRQRSEEICQPKNLWKIPKASLTNSKGKYFMANKMKVAQVTRAGGPIEIVERPIPEPPTGWVRVKVQACGVCHSDSLTKEGHWPGIQYPRVPGHEVIGVVDAVGAGVTNFKTGQRVGVGWHGGNCGHCDNCRRGDFFACTVDLKSTGISFDGGYGEYMLASSIAL